MDKSVLASCRLNYFRLGLLNPHQWKNISELRADGGFGVAVTLRRRKLSEWKDKNSVTGQPTVTYEPLVAVTGVWMHRGGAPVSFSPGTYVEYDAVFYTLDDVRRYDLIEVVGMDPEASFFETVSTEDKYDGYGGFCFRICQMKRRMMSFQSELV